MTKNLLGIRDLSQKDIESLMKLSADIKKRPSKYGKSLAGKTLGLIFEKPSTRTRISFQVAMAQMGGEAHYLGPQDMKLGSREALHDEARVLSRYWNGVVLRTFEHKTIEGFANYSRVPVINGLSDLAHPCQALADLFTVREKLGSKKPVVAYIGDGNNVLNSLLYVFAKTGGHLHFACPKKYRPSVEILSEVYDAAKKSKASIQEKNSPEEAVYDADVVYTDVWVSMGEEDLRDAKLKEFSGFQLNRDLLKKAKQKPYILHCLPAHRGEEITDDVMEDVKSLVFDQAENRLHVEKAVLLWLLK